MDLFMYKIMFSLCIKFRRQRITQSTEYNIYNKSNVWNQ